MRIHYLYNSGFALVWDDGLTIVIDYYKNIPERGKEGLAGGVITPELLREWGDVYALASHEHPDHFNPIILRWPNSSARVNYIVSSDVYEKPPAGCASFTTLTKGKTYEDANVSIRAFGSTDEGISFFIKARGLKIFHAGDLNCWHWQDGSSKEESSAARAFFERELLEIEAEVQRPDVGFFPVDPRIGSDYAEGAFAFANRIKPKLFVPMHFRESVQVTGKFKSELAEDGVRVWDISGRGDYIDFDKEY